MQGRDSTSFSISFLDAFTYLVCLLDQLRFVNISSCLLLAVRLRWSVWGRVVCGRGVGYDGTVTVLGYYEANPNHKTEKNLKTLKLY